MSIHLGLLAFIVYALMISGFLVFCYVSSRCVDYLESLLPTSGFMLANKKNFLEMGLIGKVHRVGVIALVLAFPKFFARRGLINIKEVEAFPVRTRWLLVTLWGFWNVMFLLFGGLSFL
ncbi:hypothetical protein WCE02_09530 [Pseudomonas juntendi]|uniref:hypothetical protein n=1 Tax=Pseudomonas TaxID=286 RepID=UPI0034D472A8